MTSTKFEIEVIPVSASLPPVGKPVIAICSGQGNRQSYRAVRFESKARKNTYLWGLVAPNPKARGIIGTLENVTHWFDLEEAREIKPVLEMIIEEAAPAPEVLPDHNS